MADLLKIKQVDGLGAKHTSIDTAMAALDTAQSVDSKDTSILALATAADTAQSVDSKDTSILVAANAYTDTEITDLSVDSKIDSVEEAFVREANLINETHLGNAAAVTLVSGTTYTLDLDYNVEDASQGSVFGVYINGLLTKFSVTGAAELTFASIGYALDGDDTIFVKYISSHT